MDIPPRMRDMLSACDQARDELRAEFAALQLLLSTLLSTVRAPEVVEANTTSPSVLGALEAIRTRLDQLRQSECPPCPSLPAIHTLNTFQLDTSNTLDLVLSFINLWHSETAACVVISYSWRCHVGVHRWLLLLIAFVCSPKVTLMWVGLVLVSRVIRVAHDTLSWVRGTLFARCCPLAPAPVDVEAGVDPEVRWVRDAITGVLGAPAEQPAADAPPPRGLYGWVMSGFGYYQ